MAHNGLLCADVPLRNYSINHHNLGFGASVSLHGRGGDFFYTQKGDWSIATTVENFNFLAQLISKMDRDLQNLGVLTPLVPLQGSKIGLFENPIYIYYLLLVVTSDSAIITTLIIHIFHTLDELKIVCSCILSGSFLSGYVAQQ